MDTTGDSNLQQQQQEQQEQQQQQQQQRPLPSLHTPTPLLYSTSLSRQTGCNVWIKLENMQPTQSFKVRGVGRLCARAVVEQGAKRLVGVGDTNAALTIAYSGRQLRVPVTIYVPVSANATTNAQHNSPIRAKLALEGAEVIEEGRTIKEAYLAAQSLVSNTREMAALIDNTDDIVAVAGNATMVTEINVQLQENDPAVIITTVGSGGLLSGLVTGLHRCQWQHVPVIAVETHNTNCFQKALLFGNNDTVSKPQQGNSKEQLPLPPSLLPPLDDEIMGGDTEATKPDTTTEGNTSSTVPPRLDRSKSSSEGRNTEPTVATCLQSGQICPTALELAQAHPVVPVSVSEAMAVEACRRMLDDHQMLIEIGSAAALSVVGKGLVHQIVPDLTKNSHIVVIVTGGANINFDRLQTCTQRFQYPAPTIAKSGHEIFMRMSDPTGNSGDSVADNSTPVTISTSTLKSAKVAK